MSNTVFTVVDNVPGISEEEVEYWARKAEAGFTPEELGPIQPGPASFLINVAPDVRIAVMQRLDFDSEVPIEQQFSDLLRTLLAAA